MLVVLLKDQYPGTTEIVEGTTRLLVPSNALHSTVPPKNPAFFNTRAKLNRDFSIICYSAFLRNHAVPKTFIDSLSGIGARAVRVANEIGDMDTVVINDLNSYALDFAKRSCVFNDIEKCTFSKNEACRMLIEYSKKGNRAGIVDVDPFGSPSSFLDCGIRATHGSGLLSFTATDLPVLHGLYNETCKRKYSGIPIRVPYGNEIAVRILIGTAYLIGARLEMGVRPLFVQHDRHYYRIYLQVNTNKKEDVYDIGYLLHCKNCGHQVDSSDKCTPCQLCGEKPLAAGPLWTGRLFDSAFLDQVIKEQKQHTVNRSIEKTLNKCYQEVDLPPSYYDINDIASKMKTAPLKLSTLIDLLKDNGFNASPTCLSPTGFRTDANIEQIKSTISN